MLDSNALSRRDGVAVVVFTALATTIQGGWGVVAGGLVLAVAMVTTGPEPFVAAQLWVVTALPQESLGTLAAAQLAVFPLLVSGVSALVASRTQLVSLTVAYLGSIAVVWTLVVNLRWLWQSAVAFVALAGLLAYGMHRYERVALGLVRTEDHR